MMNKVCYYYGMLNAGENMNYIKLLSHSYDMTSARSEIAPISKSEFLCGYIFNIVTYDSDADEFFAEKAIEVCEAINKGDTFAYIDKSEDHYRWYLMMVNLPFFAERIEWGGSIRGVWWNFKVSIEGCVFYVEDDQFLEKIEFNQDQWKDFINALILFYKE